MFSVATVFLLLASLVAAAGFAVIAQRRLRQLGMLAAIGATQKHLRLVLLTNGAVVGAIGAAARDGRRASGSGSRSSRRSRPRSTIASTGSACPGPCSRSPSSSPSSGQPPPPGGRGERSPASRSRSPSRRDRPAEAGTSLGQRRGPADRGGNQLPRAFQPRAARRSSSPGSWRRSSARCSWVHWRSASSPGRPGTLPIAPRLALRDLARYQARSGAALAAITLALGIAAAVVITGAAEEKQEDERAAAALPNLSDRQIRVYTGTTRDPELIPLPIQTPAQLARSAARVRQLAAALEQAAVIPLRKALQPGDPPIVTSRATGHSSRSDLRSRSAPEAGPGDRVSTSPRLPCSGTSESTPPRSIRARTSWPTRPSPPTSSSS